MLDNFVYMVGDKHKGVNGAENVFYIRLKEVNVSFRVSVGMLGLNYI